METKHYETDLAIYKKLAAEAQQVFTHIKLDIGTYTAQQVGQALRKDAAKFEEGYDEKQLITVTHGTFRCTVRAIDIFDMLRQFATDTEIDTAERVKFLRRPSAAETAVSFTLPKYSRHLARAVAKDEQRQAMEHVCVDTRRRAIVASDGHLLTAIYIPDMKVSEDAADRYLVPPKLFTSGELIVTKSAITSNGENLAPCYTECRYYPNWESVCPEVSEDISIPLGAKTFKELKAAVRAIMKTGCSDSSILLHATKGSTHLTVQADNLAYSSSASRTISLPSKSPIDLTICYDAEFLSKIPTADRLYLTGPSNVTVFIRKGGFSLLMPKLHDEQTCPQPQRGEGTPLLTLAGFDGKETTAPKPASKIVPFVPPVPKPQPTPPQPEPDEDDLCPDYPEDAAPTVTVLIPNPLVHPSLAIATIDNEDCPEL